MSIELLATDGVIGDRYRVERPIAAGGMATVFLAHDLRHPRKVAVKVLHETLAHTIGIQRFLREIEVIARLQHPHLLTLIDSGDLHGLPYYVMPYIEAQSLREYLAPRGQLGIDDAIRITREVADGLAYAHEHGILHRDIKPSNILMSGGHAVVADFGIATALQRASVGRITETGISLGSPTYMSPEQAAGERDVDARSDVYSLACVLYEMLAGAPPIDSSSMQQVVTRKLTGAYTPLRERRPDIPAAMEAVIHRALSAEREQRQESVAVFAREVADARPVPVVKSWRRYAVAAAAIAVLIATGLWIRQERRVADATRRVAEVNRLVITGQLERAFNLSQELIALIPKDSSLLQLRPAHTDFMIVQTNPAGATVSLQRLDQPDSAWKVVGYTPIDSLPIPKIGGSGKDYRVRIELAGFETREVLADLFVDMAAFFGAGRVGTLRLDSAGAARGMVRIPGRRIIRNDKDTIRLADYHIGRTEVTNAEYARFVTAGGYQKREYWNMPMTLNGRTVSWEDGIRMMRDSSGQQGPASWTHGTFPAGQEDYPVSGVSFYEAAAYAKWAGMRLPTWEHWQRAALRNYREMSWTFMRTSNIGRGTEPRRIGMGSAGSFGLFDVAGNVREWCVNPMLGGRLAAGGGWDDPAWIVNNTLARAEFDRSQSNGFRLVALVDDDTTIARVSGRITRSVNQDFRDFRAVGNSEFESFRRMYDYDKLPLNARIEAEGTREAFRWQRVTFSAGYAGERMMAYVMLPKNQAGPFDPILFWPPGTPRTVVLSGEAGMQLIDMIAAFIPYTGRALIMPVFKGNAERDGNKFRDVKMDPDASTRYSDFVVQWIKDLRRTVDYIESREDLSSEKLGYFGVSWGGVMSPIALAIETRIKATVVHGGGYSVISPVRAEVDAANYAPRVRTPVLILNGQHDNTIFPPEPSQQPFFAQLGSQRKQRIEYPNAGHAIPQEVVVRETLAWFDKYLR